MAKLYQVENPFEKVLAGVRGASNSLSKMGQQTKQETTPDPPTMGDALGNMAGAGLSGYQIGGALGGGVTEEVVTPTLMDSGMYAGLTTAELDAALLNAGVGAETATIGAGNALVGGVTPAAVGGLGTAAIPAATTAGAISAGTTAAAGITAGAGTGAATGAEAGSAGGPYTAGIGAGIGALIGLFSTFG